MGRGLDGFCSASCRPSAVFKLHGGRLCPFRWRDSERETPLPIPNRAVKPLSADGTWRATSWESRSPPVFSEPPPGAALFLGLRCAEGCPVWSLRRRGRLAWHSSTKKGLNVIGAIILGIIAGYLA